MIYASKWLNQTPKARQKLIILGLLPPTLFLLSSMKSSDLATQYEKKHRNFYAFKLLNNKVIVTTLLQLGL